MKSALPTSPPRGKGANKVGAGEGIRTLDTQHGKLVDGSSNYLFHKEVTTSGPAVSTNVSPSPGVSQPVVLEALATMLLSLPRNQREALASLLAGNDTHRSESR